MAFLQPHVNHENWLNFWPTMIFCVCVCFFVLVGGGEEEMWYFVFKIFLYWSFMFLDWEPGCDSQEKKDPLQVSRNDPCVTQEVKPHGETGTRVLPFSTADVKQRKERSDGGRQGSFSQ